MRFIWIISIITVLSFNSFCQDKTWIPVDFKLDDYPIVLYNDSFTNSLFVAGNFYHVNGIFCNHVIKVNSNGFTLLDTNNFVAFPPHSIMRYDTNIYVGGFVGLYRLKNGSWDSLAFSAGYKINSLYVDNNKLLVGGFFHNIGQVRNNGLAEFDGQMFSNYNLYDNEIGSVNEVGSIIRYKNDLVIGGNIDTTITKEILSWNGSNWFKFNGGIPGIGDEWVSDMAVYNGELYVAGRFNKTNGAQGDNIIKWDGFSWTEVGEGIKGIQVDALKVYQNKLWVGGNFFKAGIVPASNIAVWDGSQWCSPKGKFNKPIICLEEYNDTLYVGGGFDKIDGDSSKQYLVKYDPNSLLKCDSTVGVLDQFQIDLTESKLFPNPTTGHFIIEFKKSTKRQIQVYNSLGSIVYSETFQGKSSISIDLTSSLKEGIYFVKLVSEDSIISQKLILQRE